MRLVLMTVLGLMISLSQVRSEPLRVFAAASLGDALKAALQRWPGETVISVAGSGTIARQIDQGAPADVVMLASAQWMDWLQDRGQVKPDTRVNPIGNDLVVIGSIGAERLPNASITTILERLEDRGRLAIGEHRSVPAGQYAQTWLEARKLWNPLQSRLAEVDNVRAVLTLVARGEAPLGIVYQSDLAAAWDQVAEIWTIPAPQQPDIQYALAAITDRGTALSAYLAGPEAAAIFAEYGFTVHEE